MTRQDYARLIEALHARPVAAPAEECGHERQEIRQRKRSGGQAFYLQCERCGNVGPQLSKMEVLRRGGSNGAPIVDDGARARYLGQCRAAADREQAERDRRWFRLYDEYLRTPRWKKVREKVLERAGGLCEGCREQPAAQVHHITYRRVGFELLTDLAALCGGCHRKAHWKVGDAVKALLESDAAAESRQIKETVR